MLTCGQSDFRLGLTAAKMNVVEIARDRLIERRQCGIDEKVMMTGIWLRDAGSSDLHVLNPETELDPGGDCRAVLEIDKEHPGIRISRLPRRCGLLRAGLDMRIQSYCRENNQANAEKKSIHKQLRYYANMGLQGEQVAVADHRSDVCKPSRDKPPLDKPQALLQMPCRTNPSPLVSRGRALKTGLTSDKLPGLWI